MELQVLIQGPDTVHPIMVEAPDGENPKRVYAEALAQGAPVVCFGKSCFGAWRRRRCGELAVTH